MDFCSREYPTGFHAVVSNVCVNVWSVNEMDDKLNLELSQRSFLLCVFGFALIQIN